MAIFNNKATLTYGDGRVAVSNVVTGEIVDVLSITKTPLLNTYTPNGEITYAINIVNSGTTPFSGLTVTDNLGEYPYGTGALTPLTYKTDSLQVFSDGVLQPRPTPNPTEPLTIPDISVPAGGSTTILYTVTANGFAPLDVGAEIENTATLSGSGITPITATATVNPLAAPTLSITKSLSPDSIVENGTGTYTFLIENTGNTEADINSNVSITDNFDPILSNVTVTYDTADWTRNSNNYSYNAAGLFQTVPGRITVPAATFTRDPATGEVLVTPGSVTVTVSGTV